MTTDRIAENIARINDRIAAAAVRSGRAPGDVTLVAVTKYVGADLVRAVIQAGCTTLGESRPQQLWEKAETIDDPAVRWHMIGELQRNKIRRTLPVVAMVESITERKQVEAVDRIAGELGLTASILLEVNISGDATKIGLKAQDVEPLLTCAGELSHVKVCGLMGMSAWGGTTDVARRNFADLRELRDRLLAVCPPRASLDHLSMGMSGDFEIAIEEGATLVRVGSALFEGVDR